MKIAYSIVLLLLAVVFAGCVGDDAAPAPAAEATEDKAPAYLPPVPDFDFSTAIEVVHPEGAAGHANHLTHEGGFGMEPKAFTDLSPGARYQGLVTGQYNEVDVCGTKALVGSFAGNRAFTLVNITDTAAPKVYSQFASGSTNWDVRFSPDCNFVFVGMELGVLGDDLPEFPVLPAGGLHDAGRGGVIVVDVSDPLYPVRESYNDVGSVHNLFSFDVEGVTYVITNTGVITKLVGEPGSRSLEVVANVPGSHDVHVAAHPVTGHPYLFTGYEGLAIYDFANPAEPELIANLEFPDGHTMWHEQTPAPAMIDGRWVIVGAGECTCGVPEAYSVADITEPTEPAFLGGWILPGDYSEHVSETAFYTFSAHNVAIRADGRVALANYHAGTWIIDISTKERQESPVTLAYHLPNVFNAAIQRSLPYAPYVWGGAFADDGTLLVADLNSGLFFYDIE